MAWINNRPDSEQYTAKRGGKGWGGVPCALSPSGERGKLERAALIFLFALIYSACSVPPRPPSEVNFSCKTQGCLSFPQVAGDDRNWHRGPGSPHGRLVVAGLGWWLFARSVLWKLGVLMACSRAMGSWGTGPCPRHQNAWLLHRVNFRKSIGFEQTIRS